MGATPARLAMSSNFAICIYQPNPYAREKYGNVVITIIPHSSVIIHICQGNAPQLENWTIEILIKQDKISKIPQKATVDHRVLPGNPR
jgi:hypothetical protein